MPERRPPYGPPGVVEEDEPVSGPREGGQMCREHVNDNLWQRYRANRPPCLRRRQERRTAVDIHQLPIHLDSPAQKVDPVNGELENIHPDACRNRPTSPCLAAARTCFGT